MAKMVLMAPMAIIAVMAVMAIMALIAVKVGLYWAYSMAILYQGTV